LPCHAGTVGGAYNPFEGFSEAANKHIDTETRPHKEDDKSN